MSKSVYVKHELINVIKIAKIVTIHYFEFEKNYAYEGEKHNFWELVYEDNGEVIITAEDKELTLKQGEIIFHKPNEFHKIRANGITAPNVFIISFVTSSNAMKFFENKVLKLPINLKGLISRIIFEGKHAFELPDFNPDLKELIPKSNSPIGSQQLIRLYLEQLLISLLRDNSSNSKTKSVFDSKKTFDNHIVASIIEFLQNNIYQSIKISDVCKHMHYKNTYISTVFKNVAGYSVKEYYTMLKIAEAKQLIRERNYTIAEISNLLVFDSPQYFSKRFKAITGMTPREYSNSIRVD